MTENVAIHNGKTYKVANEPITLSDKLRTCFDHIDEKKICETSRLNP